MTTANKTGQKIKAYVWMWRELGRRKADPPGEWRPSVMSHPRLASEPGQVDSLKYCVAIHNKKRPRREQHAVFPTTIEVSE